MIPAIVSLILLILLSLVAHVPMVRQYVLEQGQEYLEGTQQIDLQATRLDYNLFTLSATLNQVRLKAGESPQAPPLLSADRIAVGLRAADLLRGRFTIRESRFEGLSLHLAIDEQGRINLPQTPDSEGSANGEGTGLIIESLTAPDASLVVEDQRQPLRLHLPRWTLNIRGNRQNGEHTLRLAANQTGTVALQDQEFPLSRLNINLLASGSGMRVNRAEIAVGESQLNLTGSVAGLAEPVLDLKAAGRVSLAQAASLADIDDPLEGTVNFQAILRESLDKLAVSGQLRGRNLRLGDFQQVRFSARPSWQRGAETLSLEEVSLNSPSGSLKGSATVPLAPEAPKSVVRLQFENLDLQALTRRAGLEYQIASRAAGELDLRWPGFRWREAQGDARLQLRSARQSPAPNAIPLAGSVRLTARADQQQFSIGALRALGAQVDGSVRFTSLSELSGEVQTEVQNMSATAASLATLLAKEEELAGLEDLNGGVQFDLTLGGTLDEPVLSVRGGGRDLRFRKYDDLAVQIEAAYSNSQLDLNQAEISWKGQSVSAGGLVRLGEEAPRFDVRLRTEKAPLNLILAALGRDDPIHGTADIDAHVSGTPEDLSGEMAVSAGGLSAYGEPLGNMTLAGRLAGQQLEIEQLHFSKTDAEGQVESFEASGAYNLDSGEYSIKADSGGWQITSVTLPDSVPLRGSLALSAQGSGTVDDPQLDLDLQVSRLEIEERPVGSVNVRGSLQGQRGTLRVEAPQQRLVAQARVTTSEPYPAEFEISANESNFSAFVRSILGDEDARAALTATASGRAQIGNWQQGTYRAEIQNVLFDARGQQVRNDGPIVVRFENARVLVEPARVVAGNSEVRLNGSLPLQDQTSPGELNLQATIDPNDILSLVPDTEDWIVNGRVEFNAAMKGSLNALDPSLALDVQEGFFFMPAVGMAFTDIVLSAHTDQGIIILESASTDWGGGTITASGEIPAGLLPATELIAFRSPNGEKPARLRAEARGLKLGVIGALPEGVRGQASLRVETETPQLTLEAARGQVVFEELRLQPGRFAIEQSQPVTLSLQDEVVRVDQFQLRGPETEIGAAGEVRLLGEPELDLKINGHTDAGLLAFLSGGIRSTGRTELQLAIRGSANDPDFTGTAELKNGQVAVETPPLQGEDFNISVQLRPGRVVIERGTGQLNGGDLKLSGDLAYGGEGITAVAADITARDLFLDYPSGLRTASEADIQVETREEQVIIGGEVRIREGSFRERLELGSEVLAFVQSGSDFELTTQPDPFLSKIRYNLAINTESPIVVDNNLAQLMATAQLRLVGTYYQPSLTGRLSLEEGGELRLSERTYVIDAGRVDFVSQNRIEPLLDVTARTQASGYDVELRLSGSPDDLDTTLTSEPPLPEPDIISVLLTGRTLDDASSSGVNIAKEQALSYLTGALGGRLSQQAQEALGISQVRVEPSLIASESDPAVRLTIGQDLRRDLRLIYSMNLADSGDQIYVAEYDVFRRFNTRAVKQSDNSYRLGFRHDFQFGGFVPTTRRSLPSRTIGEINITGNPLFSEEEIQQKLKVKSGKKYDFFRLQKGIDRLENHYHKNDYLESRIRFQQQKQPFEVDINFDIEAGPVVEFVFEGVEAPDDIRKRVRRSWQEGVFEAQRAQDAILEIRTWLVRSGYLQPDVSYRVETIESGVKRVHFEVDSGVRYQDVELVFDGAQGIPASELREFLEEQNAVHDVYLEPRSVRDLLAGLYEERGYRDVVVQAPRYELDASSRTGRVVIPIDEGPLYRFGAIKFEGNSAIESEELRRTVLLETGQPFEPERLQESVNRLEDLYWSRGYNDVIVALRSQRTPEKAELEITFNITENRQGIVQRIEIEGNNAVDNSFIRKRLKLSEGDVLNFERADRSRGLLYQTGAFSLVDFEANPYAEDEAAQEARKPLLLRARVREVRPYRLRYGGFFDTDRGPGAILDFENRNTLGGGRVAGIRTRYDSELKEARAYLGQPLYWGFPSTVNLTTFRTREIVPREMTSNFITDRTGLSLQQELEFKDRFILTYGYRFERAHTFDREPDPNCPLPPDDPFCRFDETFNIAPLTASLSWDKRDDILDATRGLFTSHALEYAPARLGSDLRFLKYFGQAFKYIPLTEPAPVPFSKYVEKPRVIYAGGVRVGLGRGFGGQRLILSERFRAGGGTTIRGFEQNTLGPVDALGDPEGGEGLLIVNNELRFPLTGIFEGVGFLDLGNVYPKASDFNPFDVRTTAGAGLRVRTPYFLLRFDYGFKLDREPGESTGAFFFSIGQAF